MSAVNDDQCPLCEEWLDEEDDIVVFAPSPSQNNTLAHRDCVTQLATDIEQASTVEAVRDCVDRYCRGNECGGSLHVVLADFGYNDECLRRTVECAESGSEDEPWNWDTGGPPDPLGAALGRKLLGMSLADRAAANDARACTRCGHALSLHSRTDWSCQGPCAIPDCDCTDGHYNEGTS